nr:hypothetical protein SHINE37_110212 [Rhizobiaceae bacterium]
MARAGLAHRGWGRPECFANHPRFGGRAGTRPPIAERSRRSVVLRDLRRGVLASCRCEEERPDGDRMTDTTRTVHASGVFGLAFFLDLVVILGLAGFPAQLKLDFGAAFLDLVDDRSDGVLRDDDFLVLEPDRVVFVRFQHIRQPAEFRCEFRYGIGLLDFAFCFHD